MFSFLYFFHIFFLFLAMNLSSHLNWPFDLDRIRYKNKKKKKIDIYSEFSNNAQKEPKNWNMPWVFNQIQSRNETKLEVGSKTPWNRYPEFEKLHFKEMSRWQSNQILKRPSMLNHIHSINNEYHSS